ncbi:hypothetical protein AB0L40_14325 [Patulibacter sp. NPDC049589]|uniref:hypothetical protein n=1 Tax=Patulibacter sp. NPDC049589 TaxID=3154731 RepID=UPI003434E097
MRARPLPVLVLLALAGATGCGSDGDKPTKTVAATTQVVRGFQFRSVMPAGWTDVSDQIAGSSSQDLPYDLALGDRTAPGFKPSLVVARKRGGAIGSSTLQEIEATIRKTDPPAKGQSVDDAKPLQLGRVEALQSTIRGKQDGKALETRRIIAKHGGTLYTISFTSAVGDARADAALARLLSGWRWTS